MKKYYLLALLFCCAIKTQAQVVTTDIPYITLEDSINLTFDASQGNGDLVGISPVYAHTGIILPHSINASDWKNKPSMWGMDNPNVQLTPIGGNQHTIGINIYDMYEVGSWATGFALAFVFRNADGSVVGKNANESDILLPIFLQTQDIEGVIMDPIRPGKIVEQGEAFDFEVRTNNPNSLINLYQDGVLIGQALGDVASAGISAATVGKYYLSYTAEAGGITFSDTTYYIVRPSITVQDPPAGVEPGINIINSTTVTLCLLAPFNEYCYAVGDFSNWEANPQFFMKRSQDGERYWVTINNVTPQDENRFQYYVNGEIRIADPYSYKVLEEYSDGGINPNIYPNLIPYPEDLTHGNVSVFETDMPEYQWQNNSFTPPVKEDLVIYELLIRDFSLRKDFTTVRDSLPYIKKLGANAIHIMPIAEFEGNNSWGYNPIFHLALDKKYGPRDSFKKLVDACHDIGIAVIVDVVPNHAFGRSPYVRLYWDDDLNQPFNSPFFNPIATHPFSVGFDFNHESQYVKNYWYRAFRYWIEEYRVDGYRVDLTKGLTQVNSGGDIGAWTNYDQSRVNILLDYANSIWSVKSDFLLIFEHLGSNDEETVLANNNIILWSKATDQYNQATMGWSTGSDWTSPMSYQAKGWNMPRALGYMESHDEERLMARNVAFGNGTNPDHMANDTATALYRMQAAGAMFLLIPGPKMIWQFGELGYDYSIFWPSGEHQSRTAPKPVRWNYFWEQPRQAIYRTWSAFNVLKHMEPVYACTDFGLDLGGTGKRMWLSHPNMKVSVTANFDVVGFDMTPDFQHTGIWYNYMTGEPLQVDQTNMTLFYEPGQYYIFTDQPLPVPDTAFVPEPVAVPDGIAEEIDPLRTRIFPNPTTGNTYVEYSLEADEARSIEIRDIMGRTVRTIGSNINKPGLNRVLWNGTNDNGTPLSNGQYIVTITTNKFRVSKMVVLAR